MIVTLISSGFFDIWEKNAYVYFTHWQLSDGQGEQEGCFIPSDMAKALEFIRDGWYGYANYCSILHLVSSDLTFVLTGGIVTYKCGQEHCGVYTDHRHNHSFEGWVSRLVVFSCTVFQAILSFPFAVTGSLGGIVHTQ